MVAIYWKRVHSNGKADYLLLETFLSREGLLQGSSSLLGCSGKSLTRRHPREMRLVDAKSIECNFCTGYSNTADRLYAGPLFLPKPLFFHARRKRSLFRRAVAFVSKYSVIQDLGRLTLSEAGTSLMK